MAGEWIKMRAELHTHPKVVRISSALNADTLRTVGALHLMWSVFDIHSEDGDLVGYTPAVLDKLVGWSGFSATVEAVGWLKTSEDRLSLPDFDNHNGRSSKRRAMETVRKMSARDADKMRSREEKRREETTHTVAVSLPGGTAEALRWWGEAFQASRGCAYVEVARDRGVVDVLLAASSLGAFKARATTLLESKDPYYLKGVDLSSLKACWNKLGEGKPEPLPGYMQRFEEAPAGPKVDPAIAKRAIKEAIAAANGSGSISTT